MSATTSVAESTAIERYYRLHSGIYDATRWSFLFGRNAIIEDVAARLSPTRILEVGCGTGKNLVALADRFPQAAVTGLDLSETMLEIAERKIRRFRGRVQLVRKTYNEPIGNESGFSLVLFSYALSMFNPGYEAAIAAAYDDLEPGGHIAVVDFHNTPLSAFASWMQVNHVRMEGHLRPLLLERFAPKLDKVSGAYGGVWRYLRFVGVKAV